MHSHRKVHNDIKPSNILVDNKNRYVITDLDFIASGGKSSTGTGEKVKPMILKEILTILNEQ